MVSAMRGEYLYAYLRVSQRKQETEGYSLDSQKDYAKKVAKILGLKLRIKNEGAKSSTIGQRELLEQVREEIRADKIKHIWVIERERLFRDVTESLYFRKEMLMKYGCTLYIGEQGNEVKFDSPEERLQWDLLSRFSQYENEKRTERSVRGKKFRLDHHSDKAPYMGGTPTFGYTNENKKWVINKER